MKKLIAFGILTFLTFTQANAASLNSSPCATSNCCGFGGNFSIGADWLYWQGEETGLAYGAEVDLDDTTVTSKVLRPNFKYSSGYRINADYVTPQQNWIFSGAFTHMPVNARNLVDDLGMSSFNFAVLFNVQFPIFNALSGALFTELDGDWSADYNILDLTVSRTFNLCRRLEISPYIGLRGLWICQDFRIVGVGLADTDVLTFESSMRSKIGAAGLQGGLRSSLDLTHGLSLVATFGGSVVYGWANDSGSLVGEVDDVESVVGYSDKPTKSLPSIDTFIGLEYTSCFMNFGYDIHMGWEQHLIYETNDFSFIGEGTHTTLQGLTLGANLQF